MQTECNIHGWRSAPRQDMGRLCLHLCDCDCGQWCRHALPCVASCFLHCDMRKARTSTGYQGRDLVSPVLSEDDDTSPSVSTALVGFARCLGRSWQLLQPCGAWSFAERKGGKDQAHLDFCASAKVPVEPRGHSCAFASTAHLSSKRSFRWLRICNDYSRWDPCYACMNFSKCDCELSCLSPQCRRSAMRSVSPYASA